MQSLFYAYAWRRPEPRSSNSFLLLISIIKLSPFPFPLNSIPFPVTGIFLISPCHCRLLFFPDARARLRCGKVFRSVKLEMDFHPHKWQWQMLTIRNARHLRACVRACTVFYFLRFALPSESETETKRKSLVHLSNYKKYDVNVRLCLRCFYLGLTFKLELEFGRKCAARNLITAFLPFDTGISESFRSLAAR